MANVEQGFIILPEDAAPPEAQQCMQCELCHQRTRVIWGEGNPNADIVLILDNPGAREDKQGNAFLCGTRETLQRGLQEAGLSVVELYVTYLLKCRPIRTYDKPLAREVCSMHLRRQLEEKEPQLLFGFGNVVVETLFPEGEEVSVKELRGTWLEFQGIPIAFTYHPLAVRRRPNLMRVFVEDLKLLTNRWHTLTR